MAASAASMERDIFVMQQLREGQTELFGELLERHRLPVYHFLFRMVQNQPVAEELAQEVFLRVYRSRAKYEPSAKFTTWLFRIAMNLALNWVRDNRHEMGQGSLDEEQADGKVRQISDRRPDIEQQLVHQVKLGEVRDAISRLPEKQRAAVLMHKYQEMEYTQIATVLGCSESAVKSLLFRAYETLRSRLAHHAV
ncbi:MAG: RNA polymerase sigma factor [Bryobacterales bacterium]|nr:RNA polymerase sigma factor [Bryobacterales bacterium]